MAVQQVTNASQAHFLICLLILKTLLFFASQAHSAQVITVAASDFPPYFIFNKTTKKLDISGFDIDLDKHISAMTGIEFEYIPCPWIRCLKLLKEGKIDMASTIMKTKDREAFLDFLSPGYQLVNQSRHVYFYQRQADSRPILEFSDLLSNNLAIGVVRGDVHFPQFDQPRATTPRAASMLRRATSTRSPSVSPSCRTAPRARSVCPTAALAATGTRTSACL